MSDFVLGKDIELDSWNDWIAVDENGEAYCYVGYRDEEQPKHLPYFSASAGARVPNARGSDRFIRLVRGTLAETWFLDDDSRYRVLVDRRLVLPRGSNSYFGVDAPKNDWELDVPLTVALFGGLFEEIESVAQSLAKTFGRAGFEQPRLTFSKTRSNRCDLTDAVIPSGFPYLAFGASQYRWGHVSLIGFYRLLSLSCANESPLRKFLLDDGVDEALLDRLIDNGNQHHRPLAARDWE